MYFFFCCSYSFNLITTFKWHIYLKDCVHKIDQISFWNKHGIFIFGREEKSKI